MQKTINRLQFITYQDIDKPATDQTIEFCAGGGDWVQLRIKDQPEEYILAQAKKCNSICQHYGATLIINDNVALAAAVDADGVHLGKNDMSITEARKILGMHKIIGATANTANDIFKIAEQGADYVGLGPFKFTNTKKNLSPIIGIEGYKEIIKECKARKISIPIIAIGGIQTDDFKALFDTGIYGVALSSSIAKSKNIGTETINILTEIGKAQSISFTKRH